MGFAERRLARLGGSDSFATAYSDPIPSPDGAPAGLDLRPGRAPAACSSPRCRRTAGRSPNPSSHVMSGRTPVTCRRSAGRRTAPGSPASSPRSAASAPACGWSARTAGEIREIAPGAAAVTLGVWSPGGRQLGVTVFPEGAGDGQACLVDVRDGTSTVLAAGPAARVCAVSGDGRRAVVRLGRRGARHLELVDLWSGRRTELLPGGDATWPTPGSASPAGSSTCTPTPAATGPRCSRSRCAATAR